ncbi:MAG TPA: M14 metallopeptidase family protein [Gemmatimonadaceae bacterium]|nr:M14 metallopeptidase family protein [Gemmatimonadaceae bacterium]
MRRLSILLVLTLVVLLPAAGSAQTRITTPREEFGHNFGDDYFLANYRQLSAYWQKLDRESDRMVLREIGKTAEGRPHYMAIVTSPANHQRLEHYRQLSRRLALAEGLSDDEARALARDGKAVVWIDGGLHATETLGAQQLGEMVYQMVSRTDPETMRILDDVIILFVHANPDGNDLVSDWYMRRADTLQRSTAGLPRLYQKYIGHDNNRDFFGSTQAETENMNRVLYHEWSPQILYNHHQSGPAGTVFWSPPLRDPYNYNLDPLILLGFQSLGAAMHTRLAAEGKPGATMRSGGPYDGWWNGGIRNTAAFHNTIALLTEMIGNPTPMRIPLRMERQLPSADLAYPIEPQTWHLRQSVDYSISLNRAVLDYAARNRENVLYNIYAMGKRSIERGSTDTWTPNPKRYAEAASKLRSQGQQGGGGGGVASADLSKAEAEAFAAIRKPEYRDPRAYVIPASQRDFPTATKFINALRETGITVHRATQPFSVAGRTYPAGSFVIWTAQAFRPHVIDMFEPQVHPDVFPYPGAPPTPPYDNAGWTLALQMGVEFDRILDAFPKPASGFEAVTEWNLPMPAGRIVGERGDGYIFSPSVNNSYIVANRLLRAGVPLWRQPGGAWYVRRGAAADAIVQRAASELGVTFTRGSAAVAESRGPRAEGRGRIALWDRYGGSMDAGWARWILEQFEFPYQRVFAPELDAGNLKAKFDVLVFVNDAIPPANARGGAPAIIPDVPAEYANQQGRVTADRTLPQLKRFLEDGGTVVAIGESATELARFLALPLENHLVENGQPLPRTKFYVPGSLLEARVDTTHPAAAGMSQRAIFFFDDSPVFRLGAGAEAAGLTRIAWFDTPSPLRSGWAWGEKYLEGGVVAAEAKVGKGRALFFGPEILKRAQPHGTFRLLFNALMR